MAEEGSDLLYIKGIKLLGTVMGDTKFHKPTSPDYEETEKVISRREYDWLDEYKNNACRVARYPNYSVIPSPIRAAVNVCVNKSGLSKALPNRIAATRKHFTKRLHKTVEELARQREPFSSTTPPPLEGQAWDSSLFHRSIPWPLYPTYAEHGRRLQQLDEGNTNFHVPGETNGFASVPSTRAYLESMPDNLLPVVLGLVIVAVILPGFLVLVCLRNRRCSRRLCSCSCCLCPFFKPVKRQMRHLQRWDSNESSSTTLDSRGGGMVRKLVPRQACLGTRYVVFLVMIVVLSAAVGLGIYALVDLHSQLSQLSCATGQAASTIIKGQTFTNPWGTSRLQSEKSSFVSPFSSPSPFIGAGSPASARDSRQPRLLQNFHTGSFANPIMDFSKAGALVPRALQSQTDPENEAETLPKRTGFIGFAPALDYFEDLLLSLDPKRPGSLTVELRQAKGMRSRIGKTVTDIKSNIRQLQEVLFNPSNRGESVSVNGDGEEIEKERTYHISPLAAGSSSVLSSWETLVYMLPHGMELMATSSERLAEEIEGSLGQMDQLPPVEKLQKMRVFLTDSLATARGVLEPLPRLSEPLFWGSIVAFSLMGAILLFALLYLCCMCCCKKEALVDKKGSSCGCSFLLLLVSALGLTAGGVTLIAITAVTDGCQYTREYVKDAEDIDNLFRYFTGSAESLSETKPSSEALPATAAARVLEACLLPDKGRDLVRIFGIEELVEAGTKMQEMGSVVMRREATSAALLSLQMQEAAKELQFIEDTFWLFLIDPLALEEEDLSERMFTYREVLCSGLQDKPRTLNASLLRLKPPTAAAAAGRDTPKPSSVEEGPVLLAPDNSKPIDELAALLQQLTPTPEAADRLAASLRKALQELQGNSSSSGGGSAMNEMGAVLGEILAMADKKSEAEKLQLLHSLLRLAGKANSMLQGNSQGSSNGSSNSSTDRQNPKKQQRQRELLLTLLQKSCISHAASSDSGQLLVFGVEDVEERVAPFTLASLHPSSSTSSSELTIGPSFDTDDPVVMERASEKGSAEEGLRFVNAIWWAKQKELLRAETSLSFQCPAPGSGLRPCNFSEVQETTLALVQTLKAQLEDLWVSMRQMFSSRLGVFRLVGSEFTDAASNLDCSIVYTEVQPIGHMLCDKVRLSGANVVLLLFLMGLVALLLVPCFFCLWRAGVENHWRAREAAKARRNHSSNRNATNPEWGARSPTPLTNPVSNNNNAAAAAAVAVAAAATAAAASGLSQQPMQQQQHQPRQAYTNAPRSFDWR